MRVCFASALLRCDWLKKIAPLSQPIRSKTKTNRGFLARVFPRLTPVTFALSSDRFTVLFASVVIGQSDYFGFRCTTLIENTLKRSLIGCVAL